MRRRLFSVILAVLATAALISPVPAAAEDEHSPNIKRLAQVPLTITPDNPNTYDRNEAYVAQGTDLAFEGDTMVAGSFQGFGLYKLLKEKPYIKQLSFAYCNGGQGDVSIWGDLVFVSVDSPQVKFDGTESKGECDSKDGSRQDLWLGLTWEGVRIFSIENPRVPKLVGAVEVDCGSHTHTLLPDGGKLYLYIHSYPLVSGIGPTCNVAGHRKNFIVDVNLSDPSKSEVVGSLDVSPSPGCHDVTFYPEIKLAAAACLVETQIWNIEDPAAPEIVGRVRNPLILHHSSGFSWDGKTLLIGDEHAGAVSGTGCAPGSPDSPVGAMWFYDISDPASPQELGHFGPPRMAPPDGPAEFARHSCTNHNFNVVPMKDPKKQIVSTSWYAAGISVIDFSDPTSPEEIAYYVPDYAGEKPDTWAAYWYNGRIYTNDVNLPRASTSLPGSPSGGVGVFEVKGLSGKEAYYFDRGLNPQLQITDFK